MKAFFEIRICVLCLFLILQITLGTAVAKSDKASPEAVADSLHTALSEGDAERVNEFLDPEVLIFESGGVEKSLEEYASHHMHSDMDFMSGMEREVLDRDVFETEKLAVVITRSRLSGSFQDKEMSVISTETLMLRHSEKGWKIRHIHWSSRSGQ